MNNMLVKCNERVYSIPDSLIAKYTKEFEPLTNSGLRDDINLLRDSVYQILLMVSMDPTMLEEKEYLNDFINALAIKQGLKNNKVLHDD
jgi:hypothetical protein